MIEREIPADIQQKINTLAVGGLPKWPQMLVTGVPVTVEQAKDIIFRTDDFLTDTWDHAGGNDRRFNKWYRNTAGLDNPKMLRTIKPETGPEYTVPDFEMVTGLRERIGFINTRYVNNTWASCAYIFGGHGWCHPDGTIGYVDNIGKWPSIEEVYEDWVMLAEAFPYLDLHVTLMDNEHSSDEVKPVINLRVKDGQVDVLAPDESVHDGARPPNRDFSLAFLTMGDRREVALPNDWYPEFAAKVRAIIDTL